MPIQDRHAYKFPMADSELNVTNMQPIGNVGHGVIIFGDEQDSEYYPGVFVTSNGGRAEQGEQRDSIDGDEESINMNSNDITDVDEDSINKGVTKDGGELIPGEVGRGISHMKTKNIKGFQPSRKMLAVNRMVYVGSPGTKFLSGTTSQVLGARQTVNNCSTFNIQMIMNKTRRLYRLSL